MTKQIRQGFLTENNYLENKIISRLEQIDQSQEEKRLFLEQWKVYLKDVYKRQVYRAAFLAAEDGIPVSMKHILLGVREEYEKNTGVMPAEAAGPYKMYLAE